MKTIFIFCFLSISMQLSMQKSLIDPPCTETMDGVKQYADSCFHIICSDGVPKPVACQNDICPPGKMIMGKMPDDNSKMWPACCGQLICE